jgi:hypothetical protein
VGPGGAGSHPRVRWARQGPWRETWGGARAVGGWAGSGARVGGAMGLRRAARWLRALGKRGGGPLGRMPLGRGAALARGCIGVYFLLLSLFSI